MAEAGVLLQMSANVTPGGTDTIPTFTLVSSFGPSMFDAGQPDRITVPAGVSRLETFFASHRGANSSARTDYRVRLRQNGNPITFEFTDDNQHRASGVSSGFRAVSAGDYLDVALAGFDVPGAVAASRTFLSAVTGARAGFVRARRTTDYVHTFVGVYGAIPWQVVPLDTRGSFDGTSGFVVPAGVSYALPTLNARNTNFNSNFFTAHALTVNGTVVREYLATHSYWGICGATYGLVPVSPGDVIRFAGFAPNTRLMGAAFTEASIEWIAG